MEFIDNCIEALRQFDNDEYIKYKNAYYNTKKFIILGNGGSNSAASHIAQDMTKRGGKRALAFTDPSMLTCFINDYGQDNAYVKFIDFFADASTLVILISSSGNSQNLVNCIKFCEDENISYGILTAFDKNNIMRMTAEKPVFDYHIDTNSYGVAECVHQIFLHGIVECDS